MPRKKQQVEIPLAVFAKHRKRGNGKERILGGGNREKKQGFGAHFYSDQTKERE